MRGAFRGRTCIYLTDQINLLIQHDYIISYLQHSLLLSTHHMYIQHPLLLLPVLPPILKQHNRRRSLHIQTPRNAHLRNLH